MKDLVDPKWMYLKAALFLLIGCTAAALLIADSPNAKTILLLTLLVWSMSRAYYFAFYVIERYIDRQFRFSGLISALRFMIARR